MKNKDNLILLIENFLVSDPKGITVESTDKIIQEYLDTMVGKKNVIFTDNNLIINNDDIDNRVVEFYNEDKEVSINTKKIEDTIASINEEVDPAKVERAKHELLYDLLYSTSITCGQFIKNENLLYKASIDNPSAREYAARENANDYVGYEQQAYSMEQIENLIIESSQGIGEGNKTLVEMSFRDFKQDRMQLAGKMEIAHIARIGKEFKEKFCPDRNLDEFCKEKLQYVKARNAKLAKEVGNGKEFTDFEKDESFEEMLKTLNGEFVSNYKSLEIDMDNINKREEAAQDLDAKTEELSKLKQLLEVEIDLDESPEEYLPKVGDLFSAQLDEQEEISKINPTDAARRLVKRKYPEIAEALGEELNRFAFYKNWDKLPDDVKESLDSLLGTEFEGFVEEIKTRGLDTEKEKRDKEEAYDKKYNNSYELYKDLNDEEKEQFFTYADDQIRNSIISGMEKDIINSENQVKNSVGYERYFAYIEKRKESIDMQDEQIRTQFEDNPVMAKYLDGEDVARKLNQMSGRDVMDLYASNPNVRNTLEGVNMNIGRGYQEEISKCGEFVLNMANYDTPDAMTDFLNNTYDEPGESKMKEEILSTAYDHINKSRDASKELLFNAWDSADIKGLDEEKLSCYKSMLDLKHGLLEMNLRERAALTNTKVTPCLDSRLDPLIQKVDSYSKVYNKEMLEKNANSQRMVSGIERKNDSIKDKLKEGMQKLKEITLEMSRNGKEPELGGI